MNAVHIYDWNDAPHSLRERGLTLVPTGFAPRWIAWSEKPIKSPTYLLAILTSAWIGMMNDDWHKVFRLEIDGGEMRVGAERRRD